MFIRRFSLVRQNLELHKTGNGKTRRLRRCRLVANVQCVKYSCSLAGTITARTVECLYALCMKYSCSLAGANLRFAPFIRRSSLARQHRDRPYKLRNALFRYLWTLCQKPRNELCIRIARNYPSKNVMNDVIHCGIVKTMASFIFKFSKDPRRVFSFGVLN